MATVPDIYKKHKPKAFSAERRPSPFEVLSSRGGHCREDHPLREDERRPTHSFVTKTGDGETLLAYKDVTLGRCTPMERKY